MAPLEIPVSGWTCLRTETKEDSHFWRYQYQGGPAWKLKPNIIDNEDSHGLVGDTSIGVDPPED